MLNTVPTQRPLSIPCGVTPQFALAFRGVIDYDYVATFARVSGVIVRMENKNPTGQNVGLIQAVNLFAIVFTASIYQLFSLEASMLCDSCNNLTEFFKLLEELKSAEYRLKEPATIVFCADAWGWEGVITIVRRNRQSVYEVRENTPSWNRLKAIVMGWQWSHYEYYHHDPAIYRSWGDGNVYMSDPDMSYHEDYYYTDLCDDDDVREICAIEEL